MGKRQERIPRASIPGKINDLTGKSANIVLRNRQVFLAEILGIANDNLLARNQRKRNISFALAELEEIIIEY